MTLNLRLLIDADARRAKAEMEALRTQFQATAGAGFSIGDASKVSGAELGELSGKVKLGTTQFTEFKKAQVAAALAAKGMAAQNTLAAGSVANLTSQFNDIGVMLAAGQSPLQLALQQGTQITQVIGPMGAAGAVNALRTAFVGLFNPVSIATIAIIAGGAALFQFARASLQAEEDTDRFAEALKEIEEQTEKTANKIDVLKRGLSSIAELQVTHEVESLTEAIAALEAEQLALRGTGPGSAGRLTEIRGELSLLKEQRSTLQEMLTDHRTTNAELEREEAIQERKLGTVAAQLRLYGETRAEAAEIDRALLEALETGQDLSTADVGKGIDAAARAASALAQQLGISYERARDIVALRTGAASGGRGGDPRQQGGSAFDWQTRDAIVFNENYRQPSRARQTKGGRVQADQVERLTKHLQEELDILRETDPVQKEIIRNRETLANATEAERAKVEGLIRDRDAESQALERQQSRWDLMGQSATSVLDAITDRSKSVGDALKNLAASILDVIVQGQLLGTGPFGGGGGGLLGAIFPALLPGKAAGGMVFGPGGPTEDRIPTMLSNGEFVINAAATARNRQLLELINAGAPMPHLAAGGVVGQSANAKGAPGTGGAIQINVDVRGAQGDREIEARVATGVQIGIEQFRREDLPGEVQRINNNPRETG